MAEIETIAICLAVIAIAVLIALAAIGAFGKDDESRWQHRMPHDSADDQPPGGPR